MDDDHRTAAVADNVVHPVEDSGHAPFVWFDGVPTFACREDTVSLTLSAARFLPGETTVLVKPAVTAHLRCSRETAMLLRDTIDRALLAGTRMSGGAAN